MEERGERWRRDDADRGEWRATEEAADRASMEKGKKRKATEEREGSVRR